MPKKGPEVYKTMGINLGDKCSIERGKFDIMDVYNDIYAIYKSLKKNIKGEKTFDVVNAGIDVSLALHNILKEIQKLKPAWMDLNIEYDLNTGQFYVMAYAYCCFPTSWHVFSIKDTVLKLRKENKALHDLFLSFIRSFTDNKVGTSVETWYQGYMSEMYDYIMEEELHNMYEEYDMADPKEAAIVTKYKADMEEYKTGTAREYQQLISSSKLLTADELQKRAKRFKAGHPIANLIYQGAEFMTGKRILDYTYYPFGYLADEPLLALVEQVNIIWDETDNVTHTYEQHMDAQAQKGIQEPYLSMKLTTKTKEIDIDKLLVDREWPRKFSDYFSRAIDFINEYNKK